MKESSPFFDNPPARVQLVEVIYIVTRRGVGTAKDPKRMLLQYWSKDGRLLAEHDTLNDAPFPDNSEQES